jgi:hypothetical protein
MKHLQGSKQTGFAPRYNNHDLENRFKSAATVAAVKAAPTGVLKY